MIKQTEIPAYGSHKAMSVIAHVAKAVANLQQGESVTISHVELLNGTISSHQRLHAAIHRACPPGQRFTARSVAEGIVVYRSE